MGELNAFPVSMKVAGKRIVIVGGGEEAVNKARLAVKTAAEVVVVARTVEADFAGVPATVLARPLSEGDLDGAVLVFVADDGPDGATAKVLARARGIPLNVVDMPDECDFYTPAIVDRAPVSVAIASEGDSPVLARLVRARIEAVLSPRLGPLARLAGELRGRVAKLLPEGGARRRFFEALATAPAVESALERGVPEARREALRLLDAHAGAAAPGGMVWLIGAGPGAEDLLTLRAQRLLQEADVIVFDQLVPEAVVQMGRRDAARVPVGKAKGKHSVSQSRINDLLVDLARQGKKVARLKSGDPMIFGRAGEEIAALRAAGVAYGVVPGVTAALAAAADTATPVTLRGVASGFVVATAHGAEDAEIRHWAELALSGMTLGIYMGKSVAADTAAKLVAAGLSPETPVGVVVSAGRPGRALHFGALGELTGDAPRFGDGPALILIGEAVAAGDWAQAEALAARAMQVA